MGEMYIIGPDGPIDPNNLPEELKAMLGGLLDSDGGRPTPRGKDHGWWNCEGCRVLCHTENIKRVKRGYMTDLRGEFYPLEYLKDMLKYYEDDIDTCIDIAVVMNSQAKAFERGEELPETKYY